MIDTAIGEIVRHHKVFSGEVETSSSPRLKGENAPEL